MSSIDPIPVRPPLSAGRIAGMLSSQVVVGAVVAAAFVGLYVGLQRDPQLDHLPIAVVGVELADAASSAWGANAAILQATDATEAKQLLVDHQAVAAIVPDAGSPGLSLLTAGATGPSAVGAATALVAGFAGSADLPVLSSTDVVPLASHDAQGLSGFYLVFGVTLASFILAQIMYSIAGVVALRWRIVALVVGAAAVAAVAAVLAGPVYGAIPADVASVIPVLTLLGVSVSVATLAIATVIGPFGNIISTLVFTTLGNASSGATVSGFLMPPALASIGAVLPPGAAVRAVNEASYFAGHGAMGSILVLIAWIAAAGGTIATHSFRSTRLARTASTTPSHPTTPRMVKQQLPI
ncbi:hypothetical protein GM708_12485 [Vibrio cholerae]|nr:hypothetical protein [Vibrio cholerae]